MPPDQSPSSPPPAPPPSDALLSAIVDSSDDAILSKDLNGMITSWNRSAERIFGYSREEIIGKSILHLIPSEHAAEETRTMARIRQGERVEHIETVRRRKDGSLVEVSVTVSPIKDKDGSVVGASKVARDIGDRKRTHRSDVLLASIVSSSDDAIVSKNLEGIITSWNQGAERIFGYTAEEIIGKSVLTLIPPARHEEEPKILERLGRGERVDHFETVRVRKNGEHFPVSLTISPILDASGKVIGASKIARDITELKKITEERERIAREREQLLESERIARQKAENANRMKDEFLSTISHELRTPLNAIVGWTEVLSSGSVTPADLTDGIEVIKRNAMVQAQLIEDLLDLGKISSGKMTLNVEPIHLPTIIHDAVGSVQPPAQAKNLLIKTVVGEVGGRLLGDPKRLQQVVWNLLTNAIKFSTPGGKIVVSASRVRSQVEISVADTGAGIAPDFLPHLFERFSQADASTTRHHGGLGIGLSLVKQLVELHGGTVRAESPGLDLGATFTVSLPVTAIQPSRQSQPAEQPLELTALLDLQGINVLVVDDDRDSLAVIKRILAGRNATVRTANSADDALQQCIETMPNVLLSDIGMPDKDGYELIRSLRALPGGATVPAAALTAMARSEDRTRALTAGFQGHITKPVTAAEVVAMVRSLANMHPATR